MRTDAPEIASRVFSSVLAEFSFLFGDPAAPAGLSAPVGGIHQSNLSFRGPVTGTVSVSVPGSVSEEIAANALGGSTGPGAAQDALKEFVSILAGQLVTALAGDTAPFELRPPAFVELDAPSWDRTRASRNTLGFLVDDRPVLLTLELED